MTEAKLIGDKVPSIAGLTPQDLELDDESKDFLTNPLRKDFMTEFSLGSNKLRLYGNPIFMARYSELIKSSLTPLASSKPPHELLTSGVVLERPMTALWLMMNGYKYNIIKLSVPEVLHLYRLLGYFGINKEMTNDIWLNILRLLSVLENDEIKQLNLTEKDKATIEQLLVKPQDVFINLLIRLYTRVFKSLDLPSKHITMEILRQFVNPKSDTRVAEAYIPIIAELLNQLLSKPEDIKDWQPFLSSSDKARIIAGVDLIKGQIQANAIRNIFYHIGDYDMEKLINYIPVTLDGRLETYAQRDMPDNNDLGRLNVGWKYDPEHEVFLRGSYEDETYVELSVTSWTRIRIDFEMVDFMNIDQLLNGEPLLQPILP